MREYNGCTSLLRPQVFYDKNDDDIKKACFVYHKNFTNRTVNRGFANFPRLLYYIHIKFPVIKLYASNKKDIICLQAKTVILIRN